MINKDFYPTPKELIEQMLIDTKVRGKHVCDPEGGKGDIVDYVNSLGAESVCSWEIEEDLQKILQHKCNLKGGNFLEATREDVSHVQVFVMNPPFSSDAEHIVHAWNIAPSGCEIVAICNAETIRKDYFGSYRRVLKSTIENYGTDIQFMEDEFLTAERKTGVEIASFRLFKPIEDDDNFDYESFFMEEEEDVADGGIVPYSEVRDIVGRYLMALDAFDEMSKAREKLEKVSKTVGMQSDFSIKLSHNKTTKTKGEFLKELQMSAWKWVFDKLDVNRMVTSEVQDKLSRFVKTQKKYPFSVRNVYKMIEIISGTRGYNMNKSLINIFDKITKHHHKNRYNLEGWKTNSSRCVNKKFIIEGIVTQGYGGEMECKNYDGKWDYVTDLQKALCYITGQEYKFKNLYQFLQRYKQRVSYARTDEDFNKLVIKFKKYREDYNSSTKWKSLSDEDIVNMANEQLDKREEDGVLIDRFYEFNTWYDFGLVTLKGYKKGTIHVKFNDDKVWEMFNRRVNDLKGHPLPESI